MLSLEILAVIVFDDTGLNSAIGVAKLKCPCVTRGLVNNFIEFPTVLSTAPELRYQVIVAKRGEE
jgi:hypothetical protein